MFWGYENKKSNSWAFFKTLPFPIDILSVAIYLDAFIFMFDRNDFELGVLPIVSFLELFWMSWFILDF